MRAIDLSTQLTADTAKAIAAAGYDAVCRYLGSWQKSMFPSEVAVIRDADLHLISIYESNPTQASYFTYAQGQSDAKAAVTSAQSLGQPAGTAIYFTVDYDAQVSDLPHIYDYFHGVRSAIGPYKVGVYGGYLVITSSVDADFRWQTYAWSGGKVAPGVHMYQRQNDVQVAGLDVDIDDVLSYPGWWPTPKENSMQTLQLNSTGPDVKTLQTDLNLQPFNPKLTVDGIFGHLTENAVLVFQRANNLTADGIVGPLTWSALLASVQAKQPEPTPAPQPTPTPTPTPTTHNYTLVVTEADSAIAGQSVPISIFTKDNGQPLGKQEVFIYENGKQVASDITDATSGGLGWGVWETEATTDTMEFKWTDPDGVLHTVTKTTTFTAPEATDAPVPSDDNVVVRIPMLPTSDASDAVYFNLTAPNGEVIQCQLDTGAFEMVFTTDSAKALGLVNEGSLSVQGIGGSASAYYSHANFSLNGVNFTQVPCVVQDSFTGYPLFGYRFFVDNGYDLLVSQKHNEIVIMKAQA